VKRNISIIGFMYSGKSTIGREVASRTGLDMVDFDLLIENRAEMTISEIFSRYGEDHFRDLETKILREVIVKENQLLVPGGGIVIREINRELLRQSAHVIWLRIGIDEVMKRLSRNDDVEKRPLVEETKGKESIAALLAGRERLYRECDAVVDVDGREFAEVVDQVIDKICEVGFTCPDIEQA
jgi:shikimate kinase